MDKHLDQIHIRPFLIMGRSPLLVSGMNQEVLGRRNKDKRLEVAPHLYAFSFEEPVKLEEAKGLPVRD